jgi:hypothetical protein
MSVADRRVIIAAFAIAIALSATLTQRVGMYSDDGVYTAAAESLAEQRTYRLKNVPGEPYETKAPPGYPVLLSLVWKANPHFPQNVYALKSLNLCFMVTALISIAILTAQLSPDAEWLTLIPIAVQGVIGTNAMFVAFADYLMTDLLFTALVLMVLVLCSSVHNRTTSRREAMIIGLLCFAILTRSLGVALTGALVLDAVFQRRYRSAMFRALVPALVFGTWALWAATHKLNQSVLIDYYQTYEDPAVVHLLRNPRLTWEIVAGNFRFLRDTMPWALGPVWLIAWPIVIPLIGIGAWRMFRSSQRPAILFVACYVPLIVAHPFAPSRYVIPIVPIMVLALAVGTAATWSILAHSARMRAATARAVFAVLVLMVVGNLTWLQYRYRPGDQVRSWNGADSGYRWSGFEETFTWLQHNTPRDAQLGSIFDSMYYLYTGRQGIRPWISLPETYFYPYGHAAASVGDARTVAKELELLRVDYLVIDPPNYAEAEAAIALMKQIITLPHVNGRRVFISSDGQHEIFRLWGGSSSLSRMPPPEDP